MALKITHTAPAIAATCQIYLLPCPLFLLELHSERMIDALLALSEAGFTVTAVAGAVNRFRIDDQENPDGRCRPTG